LRRPSDETVGVCSGEETRYDLPSTTEVIGASRPVPSPVAARPLDRDVFTSKPEGTRRKAADLLIRDRDLLIRDRDFL
jgi:hypothetical protein